MPGPKMGERPTDFNEEIIKQAPTYLKWSKLPDGQKLRYACREFVKGNPEDEERLMRRIMIARRNNLRDHEVLKMARSNAHQNSFDNHDEVDTEAISINAAASAPSSSTSYQKRSRSSTKRQEKPSKQPKEQLQIQPVKRRAVAVSFNLTDDEIKLEMDFPAVLATRSYKTWLALNDGEEFTYNQKYIKGRKGHDWLLKKNIWRRMKYRRENKRLVDNLKATVVTTTTDTDGKEHLPSNPCSNYSSLHHHHTSSAIIEPVVMNSDDSLITNTCSTDISSNISSQAHSASLAAATQIVDQALDGSANPDPDSDENFLHAAVVEAAVAAAVSYVQKVQNFKESSHHHTNTSSIMNIDDSSERTITNRSEEAEKILHHTMNHNVIDTLQHHHHTHHTPNPLGPFDGDALDVAAKLAAAASAQPISDQMCDDDDGVDNQSCDGVEV